MICETCGNDDKRYFIKVKDKNLCRKCIMFSKGLIGSEEISFNEDIDAEYKLDFNLSDDQLSLSNNLIKLIDSKVDVLVYAACGSGKTEIILELIKRKLDEKLRVGIAIPRRQVVLELASRLSKYFVNLKIVNVCEGYTDEIYGDLIICTTHQLFRYDNYFDILIVDEPDAFPFYNNLILENIMKKSVKGNIVYLTATPTDELLKLNTLTLFKRYHGHDLLVPKVCVNFNFVLFYELYKFLKAHKKVLIFVPTIRMANALSKIFRVKCIHSKTKDSESVINAFENNEMDLLICTTILERGVTFSNVHICVLYADHPVYSKASLIQIAGRVGRVAAYPSGSGIFLAKSKSRKVDLCIEDLKMMNA